MTRIRGVVLDVDGTLIDSNDAHTRSWQMAFKSEGFDIPYAKIRVLIGKGGDKLVPELTGVADGTDQAKRLSSEHKRIFKEEFLPKLKAFPQARELLERMKRDGLELAVASSASKDDLKGLLAIDGLTGLIESKTSSDDAENSKPDPDIVQAAVKKLGLPADEVIMLGDTPYDVEAALAAGIQIIGLRCGGWQDNALKGAIAIYSHPADLLTHFDHSPLSTPSEYTDYNVA